MSLAAIPLSDTSWNHSLPTRTSGSESFHRTAVKGDFFGKAALGRVLRRAASPSTLSWLAQAFTTFHAAGSACLMAPSFDVTATTMFLPGINTTSAYHIVFDPLCQYTVYGIS